LPDKAQADKFQLKRKSQPSGEGWLMIVRLSPVRPFRPDVNEVQGSHPDEMLIF
jgi:hypothetical protein